MENMEWLIEKYINIYLYFRFSLLYYLNHVKAHRKVGPNNWALYITLDPNSSKNSNDCDDYLFLEKP